ncbi:MAG: orotidine-5'-phosphate decarboxylase [Nitrospirae bacterium]|nr:orotidine-5'-phosphate decarboxylase [Nitrospirota bacterium]
MTTYELFSDRLIEQVLRKKSHVVVGLDPVYEKLPSILKRGAGDSLKDICRAIFDFNRTLIDATYDIVPAIKPQVAFYERYGVEGMKAFEKTVRYGKKKGLIVIEDAKRNDIGSTATAYSDGHLGRVRLSSRNIAVFDLDAITVNPFLGSDGILPFLFDVREYRKGIFILVKTSNPSSRELQDLYIVSGNKKQKVYEYLSQLVNKWGKDTIGEYGYSSVGAVVGATFPNDAKLLRKLMPKTYFLVPGFGAQGGQASDIVHCFNKDGLGAIIAASRSINYAYKNNKKYGSKHYGSAARDAVLRMNFEVNKALEKAGILTW